MRVSFFSALKDLPKWFLVTISFTQIMFVWISLELISQQYDQVDEAKSLIEGEAQTPLFLKALVVNNKARSSCLASALNPDLADLASTCEIDESNLASALGRVGLDDVKAQALIGSNDEQNVMDKFSTRSKVSQDILDQLFNAYRDSRMQLSDDPTLYTLGRTHMVHLPHLIEQWSIVTTLSPVLINGFDTRSKFTNAFGQANLLVQQTNRTLNVYFNINNRPQDKALINDLAQWQENMRGYVSLVQEQQYAYLTAPQERERDEALKVLQNQLETDLAQIREKVEVKLTQSLSAFENRADKRLINLILGCVLLQLLLIFIFKWLIDSIKNLQTAERRATGSAQKLERALERQDKMFAIIGHELRTPAASVKMQLDELLHLRGEDQQIYNVSQTAAHLLDVLDDMRIGSNAALAQQHQVASQFSVFRLLEESINSVSHIAQQYDVAINLKGSQASALGHLGFKKPIRQIIINLTKNAIIHSEGSKVDLILEHTKINQDETAFTIMIKDDGKGIPADSIERLFGAFERGDSQSEGTGLGLNVSRELARTLEQGDLIHKPNPSGGSIFVLTFTLERVHFLEDVQTKNRAKLEGKSILLVEDTPTLRMLAKSMLTRAGAIVSEAENGSKGLALASSHKFDLILTDIMMPEMDGFEMTTQLRAQGLTTPIIGVTGATVGNEAERLMNCGANAVLGKPLNLSLLENEMGRL